MTATALPRLTAIELRDAVKARYQFPEWYIEPELTLVNRRIDLVALNLWGARSWRIVGFEIKVSRGDWLRELADFQKSEDWLSVCDAFYVVTPPKLVTVDELPAGWGLLELCGARMMTRRAAAQREPRPTLPRELAARLLTRLAHNSVTQLAQERARVWTEERDNIEAQVRERLASEAKYEDEELREKAAGYDAILKDLGVERWETNASIVRSFRISRELQQHSGIVRTLANVVRDADRALHSLQEISKQLLDGPA